MKYVAIDFESFYSQEYSLRKMTPVEYVLDPRFECIGAAVCVDNSDPVWLDGDKLHKLFARLNPKNTAIISHNALFDACIVKWKYNFSPRLWIDTMSMSRALLSHEVRSVSLETIAAHLGLGVKGKTIHKVSGMGGEAIRAAGLWDDYVQYAKDDVTLCRGIFNTLKSKFPPTEFVINDMIIRACVDPIFELDDTALAEHLATIQAQKNQLLLQAAFLGLEGKADLMSNEKFAEALRRLGVEPPTKISPLTGQETYAFAKTDKAFMELEEHENSAVQVLVAARLGHKSTLEETRTQRFLSIANLTWPGNRQKLMPIPLKYHGAHTGRMSGDWRLNAQNLGRGSNLRKALRAPDGYTVLACDASQIEARLTAWLSDEKELVQDFAIGADVYSNFAAEVYGHPVNKKEHPEKRFLGKTCLAKGTLVYTDAGLTPIEEVTIDHKVWDGVEWVCHSGSQLNGWKPTVKICNVSLTPDHLVLCGTEWKEAQYLARDESILSQALGTGAVSWKLLATSAGTAAGSALSSSNAGAGALNTVSTSTHSRILNLSAARSALNSPEPGSDTGAMRKRCPTTSTELAYSIDWPQRSHAAIPQRVSITSTMASAASACISLGETIAQTFSAMYRRWTGGTTPISIWTGLTPTGITSLGTLGSYREAPTQRTSAGSQILKQKLPVYDILSAGPRHRFMVHTNQGPLIVHNCILGLGFGMGAPKFHETVRIQATAQGVVIDVDQSMAANVVQLYRRKYANIAKTWRFLENALGSMANMRNCDIPFGPCRLQYQSVLLPSGLRLHYRDLRYENGSWVYNYFGATKYIYGGKLLENVVQALDRICVMDAALRAKKYLDTFDIGLAHQVHDEIIYVVPDDLLNVVRKIVEEEMRRRPIWGLDLPLDAETKVGPNYGELK